MLFFSIHLLLHLQNYFWFLSSSCDSIAVPLLLFLLWFLVSFHFLLVFSLECPATDSFGLESLSWWTHATDEAFEQTSFHWMTYSRAHRSNNSVESVVLTNIRQLCLSYFNKNRTDVFVFSCQQITWEETDKNCCFNEFLFSFLGIHDLLWNCSAVIIIRILLGSDLDSHNSFCGKRRKCGKW